MAFISNEIPKFDMAQKPIRQKFYLKLVAWALSFPTVWLRGLKLNKVNMEGLKPPYVLLCTHMAFLDFKVTTAAIFPHRANYIVAIDGFIGREKLLRNVGCICKRKFTNDIVMIKHIKHVVEKNKDIVVIYPEARYSLIGTNAVLPKSLGKIIKLLKVPVVVLNMHGNYLTSPVWNLNKRNVPIRADFTQVITLKEAEELSSEEIFDRIEKSFQYDEYRWQKENNIRIRYKKNAEGLHKVLYQCPNCLTEYEMNSAGNKLWCGHCGKEWVLSEFGELKAVQGETEFSHMPQWYEFERSQVRKQIRENTYAWAGEVIIDSLPNAEGYIRLGKGKLTHGMDGFTLEGDFDGSKLLLKKEPLSMYSCHIEYEYFKKGDCIDLSTLHDTYYIYPQGRNFSVTKMALATEELYKLYTEEKAANLPS